MNVSVETDRKLEDETSDSAPEGAGATSEAAPDTEAGDDGSGDGGGSVESVPAERKPWRRRLVVAAVAVLIVGGFGTSGLLGWQLWQDRQVARAGEQAQAAAVEYAQVLTSIDSTKVDENFDRVLDGATGEFKDMYSESSVELRQLLIDNEAAAHGVVVESAVQSASTDEVVVLLFVDQSVSNSSIPDPRIDRSRIKMTMEFVDGGWRASKVELP
ncbi:DUF3329 domain-containing protein [Mycolicibacterium hippocampi]|uniref:DUF3329 domain-containing protein n=1 Tax=Mycolicibacterium hippocampi TaxID=659824 RepID=UPI003519870B